MIPVYIINLPHRTDRRQNMESLVQSCGFQDIHFIEPVKVNPDDIPLDVRSHMTPAYMSLNRTLIEKIIQPVINQASKVNPSVILVLEDDLMLMVPPNKVIPRMLDALKEVPEDWDMIYLEYCFEMCFMTQKVSTHLHRGRRPYCAAAILYRVDRLHRIIGCLDKHKRLTDFSYVKCHDNRDLIPYIMYPALFAQNGKYAGNLEHLKNPFSIHYYLNPFIVMYKDTQDSYPRLPSCVTPYALWYYVRWRNVFLFVLAILFVNIIIYKLYSIIFSKK